MLAARVRLVRLVLVDRLPLARAAVALGDLLAGHLLSHTISVEPHVPVGSGRKAPHGRRPERDMGRQEVGERAAHLRPRHKPVLGSNCQWVMPS